MLLRQDLCLWLVWSLQSSCLSCDCLHQHSWPFICLKLEFLGSGNQPQLLTAGRQVCPFTPVMFPYAKTPAKVTLQGVKAILLMSIDCRNLRDGSLQEALSLVAIPYVVVHNLSTHSSGFCGHQKCTYHTHTHTLTHPHTISKQNTSPLARSPSLHHYFLPSRSRSKSDNIAF